MTNKFYVYLLLGMLFIPTGMLSQAGPGVGYYGAMISYFQHKNISTNEAQNKAEQARNEGDLMRAEFWHAYALTKAKPEERNFEPYVEILQELGKCSEAQHIAQQYLQDSTIVCEVSTADDMKVKIRKLDKVNSKFLEFGVLPVGEDEILFTSNRRPNRKSPRDGKTGDYFAKIFKAKLDKDLNVEGYKPFYGEFEDDVHTGYPSMFKGEKSMIFSQNNKNFINDKKDNPLHLYHASFDGKQWVNFEPLNINEDIYNSCHSTLNSENDVLIFASDRPGGFGKMDLYASYRITEKEWSEPVNLGPSINTAENELFPILKDEVLFFSSEGHGDKKENKLDIIKAFWPNQDIPFFWLDVKSLPKPFNSKKDDLSFSVYPSYKRGFLSSNRDRGDDDLYVWESDKKLVTIEDIEGVFKILDPALLTKLDDRQVKVTLFGLDEKTITARINDRGEIAIPFDALRYSAVRIEKEGFETIDMPLANTNRIKNAISPDLLKPVETPTYTFYSKIETRPSQIDRFEVEMTDMETFKIHKASIDKNGNLNLEPFKLEKDYEIKVFKNGRLVALEEMNPMRNGNLLQEKDRVVMDLLYKDEDASSNIVSNTNVISSNASVTTTIENYEMDAMSLAPMMVYFKTNEYSLDATDTKLLDDFIATVRNKTDTYQLVIEGHTDIRGSLQYNRALSRRRADKVAAYIKSKGIRNLEVKDFGETKTVQKDQHHLNRRVEVRLERKP